MDKDYIEYKKLVKGIRACVITQLPAILKVALEENHNRPVWQPGGLERFVDTVLNSARAQRKIDRGIINEICNNPIPNIAECQGCGYKDISDKFPVRSEEELQGQIFCPQCGSEDVEI